METEQVPSELTARGKAVLTGPKVSGYKQVSSNLMLCLKLDGVVVHCLK